MIDRRSLCAGCRLSAQHCLCSQDKLRLTLPESVSTLARERTPADWRKSFKKFDTIIVEGKYAKASVAVYFDSSSACFGASLRGVTFDTKDYKDLVKALSTHLRGQESMQFSRYIRIDYERYRAAERNTLFSSSWQGDDDSKPVVGVRVDYTIVDVSDSFATTNHRGSPSRSCIWQMMEWDEALKDFVPHSKPQVVSDGDDSNSKKKLIPFTPERWATIQRIQHALSDLDQRLQALFGDDVDTAARTAQLDGLGGGPLLLDAGASTSTPKRRR